MRGGAITQEADQFVATAVAKLKLIPRATLATWPEYPAQPSYDLNVPPVLSKYKFTLMKDTLADGDIRIAVQRYRYRFLGIGQMMAAGFIVSKDGSIRPLSEKDQWNLT